MSRKYIPDFKYLPETLQKIDSRTPLCKGVLLGHFLKDATLQGCDLNQKKQLIRNLMPQAVIYRNLKSHKMLDGYTVKITEGIYTAERDEDLSNKQFLLHQSRGCIVSYEFYKNNEVDLEKTLQVAEYLRIYHLFEKATVSSDEVDPKKRHVQLVIEMPEMNEEYNVKFNRIVVSSYNNNLISSQNEILSPK